jgi:hypothetical protein
MTSPCPPAPGAGTIAPSSPASRSSPLGGLRPALTPAPAGPGSTWAEAAKQEDQRNKIRLTEVSTVRGDCQDKYATCPLDRKILNCRCAHSSP